MRCVAHTWAGDGLSIVIWRVTSIQSRSSGSSHPSSSYRLPRNSMTPAAQRHRLPPQSTRIRTGSSRDFAGRERRHTLVVEVELRVGIAPSVPLEGLMAVLREALGLLRDAEHAALGLRA